MRIAVITATFFPDHMYTENNLACLLPKSGHSVRVITCGRRTSKPKFVSVSDGVGYELQSIRTFQLPRGIHISFSDVRESIEDYQPDIIIWLGSGRYFGHSLLHSDSLSDIPVVSLYSEESNWHEFDWRKRGISLRNRFFALAYRILRGPMVKAACRRSTLVVAVTPETAEIIQGLFVHDSDQQEQIDKVVMLPLGFQPEVTRWDPELRVAVREELGFSPGDVVVCVSSNFKAGKVPRLSRIVSGICEAMRQEPMLKALVVGMREGSTSEKIRELIETGPFSDRFVCHEFANQARLTGLYNAADITLFNNPSNSIQAALGTGLYGCLADHKAIRYLLRSPEQGTLYQQDSIEDMGSKLVTSAQVIKKHLSKDHSSFRKHLAAESQWLSYDRILEATLEELQQRLPADD